MESDDELVGKLLSRRRALALLGMTGVGASGIAFAALGQTAAVAATSGTKNGADGSAVDCVAKPEMTEGPYYVDEMLNRRDIRVDSADGSVVAGTKLALTLKVTQIVDCVRKPLPGAVLDIWHCDPAGIYSGIAAEGTTGHDYLRGYQITNGGGVAHFTTVLPGWYSGRTVHVHVKIRTTGADGNAYEFTSQLFFTEDFKAAYLATEPGAAKGIPDTTNDIDMHYADIGDQMLLAPSATSDGYEATFGIALDLADTAVGADDSFSMGGGGGVPGGTPGPMPSGSPPGSPPPA